MEKNYLSIVITGAALCALAGCQDELDQNKVKDGDYVPFAIAGDKTRTAYDGSDAFQINWVDGDKVRVFCFQAEDVTDAEYSVTPGTTELNKGKLVRNDSGLKWGGSDNEHKFYAVYPSDNSKCSVDESGIATIQMNVNQTATIGTKTGSVYSTTPDMSNAFMVAYATGTASQTSETNPVKLAFKPIMTTLEIIVQGKADNSSSVQLTGISLSMEVPTTVASTGKFQYDIANGQLITGDTGSSVSTTTETIFVNLVGNDNTNALTLGGGESVKITAFLPPVPVNLQNQVKVRVHATGAENLTVTLGKAKTDGTANINIEASQKATNITLPKIPTIQKGNNWITPLDDNIYLTQLSIPGTHDTFTYAEFSFDGLSGVWARTQTEGFDITQQLQMGIRAFDFRIARGGTGIFVDNTVWFYHGVVRIKLKFEEGLKSLISYLDANPGECAVVLVRHETEINTLYGQSDWASKVNTILADSNISSHIVPYSSELTLGDVRGKIVILTRMEDQYESTTLSGYGRLYGWAHGEEGVKTATVSSSEGTFPVWIQDKYSIESSDPGLKWRSVKGFMDDAANLTGHSTLVINHTSGYVGTLSDASQYIENAGNTNPKAYEYLTGNEKPVGNVGIIMMDYVGSRTVSGTDVYGDLLPQAIIDNNYKYRMLRKGEE